MRTTTTTDARGWLSSGALTIFYQVRDGQEKGRSTREEEEVWRHFKNTYEPLARPLVLGGRLFKVERRGEKLVRNREDVMSFGGGVMRVLMEPCE